MKLEVNDILICKKDYYEYNGKENWADVFIDKVGDILEDVSEYLEGILKLSDEDWKKLSFYEKIRTIIYWFMFSPFLLIGILLFLLVGWFAYRKETYFFKDKEYKIEDIDRGYYQLKGKDDKNFWFVLKKEKRFSTDSKLFKHFGTKKEIRKLKLKKIKKQKRRLINV